MRFMGNSRGNVFFAIFGAVALVGILGASMMTFMKGPLTTAVKLTKMNTAENQMAIGAQVAVMATASQSNSGDCDSDGYVEPIEWRAATTEPIPTNGGLVPLTLGINKKDPWGTEYGYCVWNHGSVTSGSGCDANMLTGTNAAIYPVVALVSAGPDKAFTTTCRTFATADVNSDGDLQDATDLELVSKAAPTDDDIIFTYTYEEATGAAGGLWTLKSGDPTKATIAKDVEVAGSATFSGGVVLPSSSLITCDGTTAGVMAKNASGTGLQICDGTSWVDITGGSSSSCPSGYTANGSRCYKVVNMGGTGLISWAAARTACQADGGDLVTFNDASENTAVVSMVAGLGVYIGYSDTALEGTFVWNDASSSYSNWASGEPNGGAGENCGGLYWGDSGANDVDCAANGYTEGYVCETAPSSSGSVGAIDDLTDAATDYTTDYNMFMGDTAGASIASGGQYNLGVGQNALTSVTTGDNNYAFGYDALSSLTDGNGNLGIGNGAGGKITSGGYNVAIGSIGTLQDTNTGNRNMAIGNYALGWNTTGEYNIAIGVEALTQNHIGSENIAIGEGALRTNDAGSQSVAIGISAMANANSASSGFTTYNTAVGYEALMGSSTPANNTGTNNTAFGYKSLTNVTSGGDNTAVGSDALGWLTTGSGNTAMGQQAGGRSGGSGVRTGDYNTFIGQGTGTYLNGASYSNVAIGEGALQQPGSAAAYDNVAIGRYAMYYNTSGFSNVAVGRAALQGPSSGANSNENVAIGRSALEQNSAGSRYVAVGFEAMRNANNTTTAFNATNTAIGYQALYGSGTPASNTGTDNTAVGYRSLVSLSSGGGNTAIGPYTLENHTVGDGNVAIGPNALQNSSDEDGNVAIGRNAMLGTNGSGGYNVAIGYNVIEYGPSAWMDGNVAVGSNAMNASNGSDNVAIGSGAYAGSSSNVSTGSYNIAIGTDALASNMALQGSVAIGYQSMKYANSTTTGALSYNTAAGYQALMGSTTAASNTGTSNTAVGYQAMAANTSGGSNVAIGRSALAANTTTSENVAIGYSAMGVSTTAEQNTAIGWNALGSLTTGDYNVAIGNDAGTVGTAITTGSYNTFVGYNAQSNANNYTNGTALGNGAVLTGSNRIVLGNTSIASIYAQVTSITAISDKRKKKDIEDMPLGLDFIDSLRPVQYRYNNGDDTLRFGFIAQETEAALPDNLKPLVGKKYDGLALVNMDDDKNHTYRMAYGELTAPLVKAVQEQQGLINQLRLTTIILSGIALALLGALFVVLTRNRKA